MELRKDNTIVDRYRSNWNKINDIKQEIINLEGFGSIKPLDFIKLPLDWVNMNLKPLHKNLYMSGSTMSIYFCNHQTRSHLVEDLKRYLFLLVHFEIHERFQDLKTTKVIMMN
jgi:DNA (cytosine-5)-methyltransferase 1